MSKKFIWNDLLNENTKKNKLLNGNILVLGSKNTGKKEIINSLEKLNGNEIRPEPLSEFSIFKTINEYEKNYWIDYRLLIVNSEENEDLEIGKLNFIIINEFWDDIDEFLNENIIENLMVIIVLDSENPHDFLKELLNWMDLIQNKLIKLFEKYPKEKYVNLMENLNKKIDKMNKKLKENYLLDMIKNLGFPIWVVCNKCDQLQNNCEKKEIEIINYNLRKFCVNNSAGLIYVSSKLQTNIDILYSYMNYMLLDFKLIEKIDLNLNSFFITNCFENNEILDEIFTECKDVNYENQIKKKKVIKEVNVPNLEDIRHQVFLINLLKSKKSFIDNVNNDNKDKMDSILKNS